MKKGMFTNSIYIHIISNIKLTRQKYTSILFCASKYFKINVEYNFEFHTHMCIYIKNNKHDMNVHKNIIVHL